jgi:tRNA A-37 threonylcarbamoyl transferase component Bud32
VPAPHASGPGTAVSRRREARVLDDGNETTVASVRLNDVLSGRYRLEQKIGEGGMGAVYLGIDLELDRKVAVKLLMKNLVDDAEVVERFEREARLTAKLDHPNIVPIYDVGRHEGRPFIVMKLLEGDTLAGRLRSKGGFTAEETLKLMRQLASGLDYIHRLGFIHRDVKAGNIFVGPDGLATILDFGILRAKHGHDALTRTGVVMGTPHYMAPEQALGSKNVDHRVDLYALAVVLFECLTGTLPFEADSELGLIQLQAHAPPPDLIERAPWVKKPVADVVRRALAKRAEERYSSGAELLAALEAASGSLGTPAAAKASTKPGVVPAVPTHTLPSARKLKSGEALNAEDLKVVRPSRAPWVVVGVAVLAAVALGFTRPWESPASEEPVATAPADAGALAEPTPDAGGAVAAIAWAPEDAGEAPVLSDDELEDVDAGSTLDAGVRRPIVRVAKKGTLNVTTNYNGEAYWAQLWVDGVPKGRTPQSLLVSAGRYQVRIERPGFKSQQREIRVASGKVTVVRIDLTQ